jgi:hypothetical protein
MKCAGSLFANDPSTSLVSSQLRPGPPLGEASAKLAFVLSVKTPSGRFPMHVDMLFVQQGRAIALLVTTSAFRSATGQELLLSRLVSRMEKPTA